MEPKWIGDYYVSHDIYGHGATMPLVPMEPIGSVDLAKLQEMQGSMSWRVASIAINGGAGYLVGNAMGKSPGIVAGATALGAAIGFPMVGLLLGVMYAKRQK